MRGLIWILGKIYPLKGLCSIGARCPVVESPSLEVLRCLDVVLRDMALW